MAGLGKWYVELEKQGYWRGVQHTWVNRYIMSGADPSQANAVTVIGALHDIEGKLYPVTAGGNGVGFVEGRAYASTGGPPFAIVSYNPSLATATSTGFAGNTAAPAPAFAQTLESCIEVRTPVIGLSSTGKPIWLRKYFRGISYGGGNPTSNALIPAAALAYINATCLPWFTGVGGTVYTVQPRSALHVTGGPPQALNYEGNRQVPKGRKKAVTVKTTNGSVITIKKFGSPDSPDDPAGLLGDLPVL